MRDPRPRRKAGLSRRELLSGGVAAGAALALERTGLPARADQARVVGEIDFRDLPDGAGWGSGWRTTGVANLRRRNGLGLLEAGSDVFPNDPRPVAFALDRRLLDLRIAATTPLLGSAPGLVVRRVAPRRYYAAVLDIERRRLALLVREGSELRPIASAATGLIEAPVELSLEARGRNPTRLRARLAVPGGRIVTVSATDSAGSLQRPGDAGVLATAQTLFPSAPTPLLPALGNLHLLPWGVQEGQAVMDTALGELVIGEIARRSTAGFERIVVESRAQPRGTPSSAIAATTGVPLPGGAVLRVAADAGARVDFELSHGRAFPRSRFVPGGRTDQRFCAASAAVTGLEPGRRVYWRPLLERNGVRTKGPVRSFLPLPRGSEGSGRARIAVLACAAQFGPIFEHLEASAPDVLVWQGDLNYPDTHGPLAQTVSGYAGIWRDFLANPLLGPTLARAAFAPQRDDHDYGVQDANRTLVGEYPHGLEPWEALMNDRDFYRFAAGPAEVWVLDQRRFKSDPEAPDGAGKTLLGRRQRRWLIRTLTASPAPFKLICSPCTVFMSANARDGNWATGFEAERELLLGHIRRNVRGRTIFLTGDTHLTGVYESGRSLEVRAAPVGIPKPNDITLVDPLAANRLRAMPGVAYAGDECHLTLLEIAWDGDGRALELSLVREDGARPFSRRFTA